MPLFTSILLLLLGAIVLARIAWGVSAPYPSFLAIGGAVLTLVPGTPAVTLEPSLALALFVAPVLLDSAYDISIRDLKDNWTPITTLVLVAVGVTTLAVAALLHSLVPGLGWAAAIAIGAIVAPPDAAAASAVLRQVRVPHRLVLILEGESLFNDATALLIFGVAVSATQEGEFRPLQQVPAYVAGTAGSVILGAALGWLYPRVASSVKYTPASIVLQFTGTFGVWVIAERLHLSPILTIVAYGIAIAHTKTGSGDPLLRFQSYAVWDTIVFLMNVLAFTLIGLQLRPLMESLSGAQREEYLLIAIAVLAAVILVRIAWVMTFNSGIRFKNYYWGMKLPRPMAAPTARGGFVIAWSGMRGIVTLAAALSLPASFPYRDLAQLIAFAVVFGTLVFQGLTLGPLIRLMKLPPDNQVQRETDIAREAALRAALGAIDGDQSAGANALRTEYCALLSEFSVDETERDFLRHETLRIKAVDAARDAISKLRRTGDIGDDAYRAIEEALDRSELYARRHTD